MKDKSFNKILFFIGFLILFFYYGLIHPLVPFDTDDWMNLTITRPFYPSLHCWNPTKVFPELLEPTVAKIAVRFIFPVIGDYVNALIMANAIVISFFITVYLYLIQKLLTSRFKLSLICSFFIVVIFALLHFFVLKTKPTGNDYLWYAEDCNCYYHYIVSNLICSILVLCLMIFDVKTLIKGWHAIVLGIVSYFALFSNLYSTVILIAYVGATLLYDLVASKKSEAKWMKTYIHQHSYYLIVMLLWLAVQMIEVNGIRANSYGHINDSLSEYVLLSMQNIFAVRYNVVAIIFIIVSIVGAKTYDYLAGHHGILHIGKRQVIILMAAVLSLLYLTLLSSKVNPENLKKGQVIFSWAFHLLLMAILCLGYLCSKMKGIRCLLPLAIFLVVFNIQDIRSEFLGVQCLWGTSEYECISTNRDIINQVRFAEALGKDSVSIHVPKFDLKDNWPLASDCGFSIGNTLSKHKIIQRNLKSSFVFE